MNLGLFHSNHSAMPDGGTDDDRKDDLKDDPENKDDGGVKEEKKGHFKKTEDEGVGQGRPLPTSPISWSVSERYSRKCVQLLRFLSDSIFDLEYTERAVIRDGFGSRIVLGKPTVVRPFNQEVESAVTSYISGFLGQNYANFTVTVTSRAAASGSKRSLLLGVDTLTSSMVKDLSAT